MVPPSAGPSRMLGGMMMLPAWEVMKCECGGANFIRKIGLRWHPTGGTTEAVGGWLCAECLKTVDMAELINRARLLLKQEELKTLQAELRGT